MASGVVHLAPGDVFADDFRVVRPLSSGGMGAVYVAEQLSTGVQRALKLMHPQLVADPKLRQRFAQEARVGARIESEHVVQVVAAGIDGTSGAPWLAMELLRGEDLATVVARVKRVPLANMLAIMDQLCHAIGAAHQVGVVHRDIKPENIFLAQSKRADAPVTVKVLDFGISKIVSEAKSTATAALGSPMWMAPEQTERGHAVGPPTDVWALGLLVFYMLSGRSYWLSAEDDSASVGSLLREIVLDPMPPASVRAADYRCPDLVPSEMRASFDQWFARAVNRDPRSRFMDAAAAHAALVASVHARTVPVAATVDDAQLQGAYGKGGTAPGDGGPPAARRSSTTAGLQFDGARPKPRTRVVAYSLGFLGLALIGGAIATVAPRLSRSQAPPAAATGVSASNSRPPSLLLDAGTTPSAHASAGAPSEAHALEDRPFKVGDDVFVRNGPLSFVRGTVAAARGGIVLVGDTEYPELKIGPAKPPPDWAWQEGDAVLFETPSHAINGGIVTHVRIDGQLTVRAWDGRNNVTVTFSPPAALKPTHLPLSTAVPVRKAWLGDLVASLNNAAEEKQKADQEARERTAEEQRKAAVAAAAAESAAAVTRRACIDNCNNSFVVTAGNPNYDACVAACH